MKTIYTAIFGQYEQLKEPTVITPGWRYVCYTDHPVKSSNWEIIQVKIEFTPRWTSRVLKIRDYPKVDQSIWIDGSFTIISNLDEFWKKYFIKPFTVFSHYERNCIYKEAAECIRLNLDAANVHKQIEKYRKAGMPHDFGMIESGILLRDNSLSVIEFCKMWFEELKNGSIRDQIAFPFVQWQHPIAYISQLTFRNNPYFSYTKHKRQ